MVSVEAMATATATGPKWIAGLTSRHWTPAVTLHNLHLNDTAASIRAAECAVYVQLSTETMTGPARIRSNSVSDD